MPHQRLREAREDKGWSIDELSRRSGLRPHTIALIDGGRLDALPAGLYGRSAVRSYAVAVGLHPEEVLESLRSQLRSAEDPLDGLARRCGHARKPEPRPAEPILPSPPRPPEPCAVEVMLPALPVEPAAAVAAAPLRVSPVPDDLLAGRWPLPVDMDLAPDSPGQRAAAAGPVVRERSSQWWRPVAASAIDALLLAAIGGGLVWLTSLACATSIPATLRSGAVGIAVVFALIVALYFVLFGGVGDATPGVSLMRPEPRPTGRLVLNPRAVFGRAYRSIFDSSLLADQ